MKTIFTVVAVLLFAVSAFATTGSGSVTGSDSMSNLTVVSVEEFDVPAGGSAWAVWNQFYRGSAPFQEWLTGFCKTMQIDCSEDSLRHLEPGIWYAPARSGVSGTYIVRSDDGTATPDTVTLPMNVTLKRDGGRYVLTETKMFDVATLPIVVAAKTKIAEMDSQIATLRESLSDSLASSRSFEGAVTALGERIDSLSGGIDMIIAKLTPPEREPLTVASVVARARNFTVPEGWLFAIAMLLLFVAMNQRSQKKELRAEHEGLRGSIMAVRDHAEEASMRADRAEALFAEADEAISEKSSTISRMMSERDKALADLGAVSFPFSLPRDLTRVDGHGEIVYIPIDPRSTDGEVRLILAGSDEPVLVKNIARSLRKSKASRDALGVVMNDAMRPGEPGWAAEALFSATATP